MYNVAELVSFDNINKRVSCLDSLVSIMFCYSPKRCMYQVCGDLSCGLQFYHTF